ncbi:MAG: urease accessory protein UreF, partial [Aquabacterium sp.]
PPQPAPIARHGREAGTANPSPGAALPDTALLRLIWLASPALPVGGFSYSEGLEGAIDQGFVHDEASTLGWLHDQLILGAARSEWPLLAAAHRAWQQPDMERLVSLNDWMMQTRESAELLAQALQMGRSMAAWLREAHPGEARVALLDALRPAPLWPLAWALGAVLGGASERAAMLAFGFGWCENQVQGALKAVPLGQAAGRRVLQALADALPAAVDASQATGDADRVAYLPGLAIASAGHETQYSRLFRS